MSTTLSQYKSNNQLTLPSVEALFSSITKAETPFTNVNYAGQKHVIPLKEGLLIVVPMKDDILYRLPLKESNEERDSRKQIGPKGEITYAKPPQKPNGRYEHSELIPWNEAKRFIAEMQKDAINFFNLLSIETRHPNFGRQARADFDLLGTSTITRQLKFLCAAMGHLKAKPPIIIYSYALEVQPASIYRQGVPYQSGDVASYETIEVSKLFEELPLATDKTMIVSMKYFNYADTCYMQTGGSMMITTPYVREQVTTSTPTIYSAVDL